MCYKLVSLFLILFCINLVKCKAKEDFNCDTVGKLLEKDQLYRNRHLNLLSPYLFHLDTIMQNLGYNGNDDLSLVSSEMLNSFKPRIDSLVIESTENMQSQIDSIWKLQNHLDSINVLKLVQMIEATDTATLNKMPYKCGRESFIIFVHSPYSLGEKVLKIINKINLKKIDEEQYNHIVWHLNGRVDE